MDLFWRFYRVIPVTTFSQNNLSYKRRRGASDRPVHTEQIDIPSGIQLRHCHPTMNGRSILHVLLAVAGLTFPSPAHGFFFRCAGGERCGLFGVVVHDGTPGTDTCEEYCVFFAFFATTECGGCDLGGAEIPTPSPIGSGLLPPLNSQYDIELSFVNIPSSDESLFTNAVERWESVIVGDLPPQASIGGSFSSGCSPPLTIDDLYICAQYATIDGPGRVLGSAGPTWIRSSGLTIAGEMEFDSADVASLIDEGNFDSVILHEMGHILGK